MVTSTTSLVPGRLEGKQGATARNPLVRNLSFLASGQLATWTATAVYTLIVPRGLGARQMGILTLGWSAAALFGAVIGLGTGQFLAQSMVSRPQERWELLGAGLLFKLAILPVFGIVVLAYFGFAGLSREEVLVLLIATVATVVNQPAEPIRSLFQAEERMQFLAYSDAVNKLLQCVWGVTVVLLGAKAVGVSLTCLAASAVVVVLNFGWLRQRGKVAYRRGVRRLREVATGSVTFFAMNLVLMVYIWIDTVILGQLVPAAVVGWYGVATRLAQTLAFVPSIATTAWFPRLVSAAGEGRESLYRSLRAPVEMVFLAGMPVAVATVMLAGPIVHALYGSDYSGAAMPLMLLGASLPLVYLNTVLATGYLAWKRPLVWTKLMVLAALANPALNLWLIPVSQRHSHNGATGAALALGLTELMVSVGGMFLIGHHVLRGDTLSRVGRLLVASAGMVGIMYALRQSEFVLQGIAGLTAFVLLVLLLRVLTPEARQLLSSRVNRRRKARRPRIT